MLLKCLFPITYSCLAGGLWCFDGPGHHCSNSSRPLPENPLLRHPSWEEHMVMLLGGGGSKSRLWSGREGRGPGPCQWVQGEAEGWEDAENSCTLFHKHGTMGRMLQMAGGTKLQLWHYWATLNVTLVLPEHQTPRSVTSPQGPWNACPVLTTGSKPALSLVAFHACLCVVSTKYDAQQQSFEWGNELMFEQMSSVTTMAHSPSFPSAVIQGHFLQESFPEFSCSPLLKMLTVLGVWPMYTCFSKCEESEGLSHVFCCSSFQLDNKRISPTCTHVVLTMYPRLARLTEFKSKSGRQGASSLVQGCYCKSSTWQTTAHGPNLACHQFV